MKLFNWKKQSNPEQLLTLPKKSSFKTSKKIGSMLDLSHSDISNNRYKYQLYRFLTDSIPVVNSCIMTWVRLSSAPGKFVVSEDSNEIIKAEKCLIDLNSRIFTERGGRTVSIVSFLSEMFTLLYRDGLFGGFLTVTPDGKGVDKFIPIDSADIISENDKLSLELDNNKIDLNRDDFYYIPFNGDLVKPMGRSILQTVPFVAFIEQQLVDDMRRSSHNSGFHRLHVKVTPPERIGGESDKAYIDRINKYFDATVDMIKGCDVEDNPVTWDNVSIETIGPENVRTVTNSWFLNHRAVIEEICAATNLAPFLLGYSYGATSTWSSLKFDIVMRQVKSVQAESSSIDGMDWEC